MTAVTGRGRALAPTRRRRWPGAAGFLGALALTLLAPVTLRTPWRPEPVAPPPQDVGELALRTWKQAARRVEEDRGERVGNRAAVRVPPELLHYRDRRRFLAVQVAETEEQDYSVPGDDGDLAAFVRSGEFVEMSPVGDAYVLYGIGAHASGEPFSHHDRESGLDIPLYPDYLAFEEADQQLDAAVGKLHDKQASLRAQLARLPRGAARRRALAAEAATLERTLDALIRRQERIACFYEEYQTRRMLAGKLRLLEQTARDLGRRDYDLDLASDRRAFRGRLLSLIRPEARDVLLEMARLYHDRFGRPLPVTSLARSQRYQDVLRRTNPNAAAIAPPPHSTGLAFDVYTRYMSAGEQEHLLAAVAQLERAGRLEALFERSRDHVHVFVFADGARPAETLIARSLARVRPAASNRRAALPAKGPATAARPSLPALRGR